jgi:hypothetical protein
MGKYINGEYVHLMDVEHDALTEFDDRRVTDVVEKVSDDLDNLDQINEFSRAVNYFNEAYEMMLDAYFFGAKEENPRKAEILLTEVEEYLSKAEDVISTQETARAYEAYESIFDEVEARVNQENKNSLKDGNVLGEQSQSSKSVLEKSQTFLEEWFNY